TEGRSKSWENASVKSSNTCYLTILMHDPDAGNLGTGWDSAQLPADLRAEAPVHAQVQRPQIRYNVGASQL
uniref:hypothetical protein n=1 Tax=Klebsiella pneumoniae TaxID=573 RepID=UPI0019536D2F